MTFIKVVGVCLGFFIGFNGIMDGFPCQFFTRKMRRLQVKQH
nr:MAG TPA: protein of unknown function DUF2407 [Bacteriophage sp.]